MAFFEGAAEDTFAGKACVEADVFDGQPGVLQQVPGGGHAGIDQIFVRSESGFFFESSDEVVGAQARLLCQPADGDILREMFVDIGDNSLCHASIAAGRIFFRRKEQEFRQDVRKIFGQQRFPDDAAGPEGVQNGCQPGQDGRGIRNGKNMAEPGGNVRIISPCKNTVKMAPQAFGIRIGLVGMLMITVQEEKVTGCGTLRAAIILQQQFAFFDIH